MVMMSRRTFQASGYVLVAALSACAEQDVAVGSEGYVPTWEEFRASAAREVDGDRFYMVDWDIPIRSEERLWSYYQQTYADEEVGSSAQPLIIHQFSGSDDVWSHQEAADLRYCVSTSFADYPRAVAEMQKATSAWMSVINVRFTHVSSEDTNCTNTNTNVVIPVRPWSSGGACAFVPHDPVGDCVADTLVIDYNDFDTNPDWPVVAPNMDTIGVLRHELGHVLGFHHEWFRSPSSVKGDSTSTWRAVTDFDPASVMQYPWKPGALEESDMSLTNDDDAGSMSVYGMSTALMTAIF
ncbi:matrixin family metalloprotease [Sorangium sp. So ce1153]|uniref:matrixin family metalloprotease n=1 Tax=Sorangium sp. So ce1153 TaxID=3133333 RepID=UPI003F62DC1A